MKSPILGQAYVARSKILACNEMINLYPEQAPSDSKEAAALILCPRLYTYSTDAMDVDADTDPNTSVTNTEARGAWKASNGTAFQVVGNTVYTVLQGSMTSIGTLRTTIGPVIIRDNGTQAIFVDGASGYISPLDVPAITEITSPNFPFGCQTIAYIDTYFIAGIPNTQEFGISAQGDGRVWDSLDWASAEGDPDNIVAVIESHRQLFLLGVNTGQVAVNSGFADFPFSLQPTLIEHGCVAPYSVVQADNSVFWLGRDPNGEGIVYRASGSGGSVRVSTHAIEFEIGKFERIDDCRALVYQQEGHIFILFTFPSANNMQGVTLCYDCATNGWHKRGAFENGGFIRWRGNSHMFHERKHLVGDFETGELYELSLDVPEDPILNDGIDGDFLPSGEPPLKWLRSWREPNAEKKLVFYSSLEIDCEMGIGPTPFVGADVGIDWSIPPQMMMEYSDDGGYTWSSERTESVGLTGEFNNRVKFHQCGAGRDRVWRISGHNHSRMAIVGAYTNPRIGRG